MVQNDLKLYGGSRKPNRNRKPGAPGLPPSTLPQPSVGHLPNVPDESKTPAQIDPGPGAGSKTPSQGGGGAYTSGGGSSPSYTPPYPEFQMPGEDEESTRLYEEALKALEELRKAQPQYDNRYDEQIRALYEQLTSRGPFRYDSATDPLYQQYRQDYTSQGRMAMRDTMGQAAALTGGYGSSYSQSVGQQQYDAYLRRLADVLPETYGMALNAWTTEGRELQQRYDAAVSLEQSDYARYLDELGQYNRDLDRARSDAETAYERKRAIEEEAYRRAVDEYNRRLAEQKYVNQQSSSRSSYRSGGRKKTDGKKSGSGNILGSFNKLKGR